MAVTGTVLALALTGQVDPGEARRQAKEILAGRRYRPATVPRPFEGVLRWLGNRLQPIGDFLDRLTSSAAGVLVLSAALIALVLVIAMLLVRRRGGVRNDRAPRGDGVIKTADPALLEREADVAEGRGELGLALRLRFRAGLLRLDRAGAIELRPSLTTGQVSRRLRRRDFDHLAITFDRVAYGGRPASPADVQAARATWPRVLGEVRHP